jgi:hypothetical protein
VDKGGEQKAPSRRNHPGAVRERSQGLSLRNPWIDSVGQSHPGGMREKTQISPDPFLASLRDALSRTMQPGVSKTQPLATIFDASGVRRLLQNGQTPGARLKTGPCSIPKVWSGMTRQASAWRSQALALA